MLFLFTPAYAEPSHLLRLVAALMLASCTFLQRRSCLTVSQRAFLRGLSNRTSRDSTRAARVRASFAAAAEARCCSASDARSAAASAGSWCDCGYNAAPTGLRMTDCRK